MAEEKENNSQAGVQSGSTSNGKGEEDTGDPGRTPGSAEGDLETVEEDLKDKEGSEQK